MKAKTLQVCGTGSSVGKSVIVTALCRIFLQDGYKVCPFKAQNMSLNSFVTQAGDEMGRAQVVQAQACRITAHADMNPVLIKPATDKGAQIIVQGKPVGNMSVKKYINYKPIALKRVVDSFDRIKKEYEIIVIEGAGSPVEINLKRHDIVNMKMAQIAKAPVILAADIDKGGVFASLIGTLKLLEYKERKMIKGFLINKFRGDKALLNEGLRLLEGMAKKPVLGVIPYFKDIRIPQEDSAGNPKKCRQAEEAGVIEIGVIKLPHISNFTDFDPLENEPDVKLNYICDKYGLNSPDVLIIPGTKNTISDLVWLKESGIRSQIMSAINSKPSTILIGVCGGYQMLGREVYDTKHIESGSKKTRGLGVLPIITYFKKEKILSQVKAKEIASGLKVCGYEIHHGRTRIIDKCRPAFQVTENCGKKVNAYDGAMARDGRIWGTYMHGVFDEPVFRRDFLNRIRRKKNLPALPQEISFNQDKEFDKLADLVRKNIDTKLLYKILNDGI